VRAGKVRYIASSNLAGWQIADADHLAHEGRGTRFIASQIEWSLVHREVESDIVPSCRAHDVGIVTFYPLASGLLTGKYRRGEPPPEGTRLAGSAFHRERMATDRNFDVVERLSQVGQSIGRSMLEMAIGWLTHQPGVASVLVGASTPDQVAANAAVADVALSAAELAAIGGV
jgi:aryl-alcohol dehydrogenase-like predicted oxidoreductase